MTPEQRKWYKVWLFLQEAYKAVPRTPEGEGFRQNLAGFFDECDWEERLPKKFRK